LEEINDIEKTLVLNTLRLAVQNHQPRTIPLSARELGNPIDRQFEIKIRNTHSGRKRETIQNVDLKMIKLLTVFTGFSTHEAPCA